MAKVVYPTLMRYNTHKLMIEKTSLHSPSISETHELMM